MGSHRGEGVGVVVGGCCPYCGGPFTGRGWHSRAWSDWRIARDRHVRRNSGGVWVQAVSDTRLTCVLILFLILFLILPLILFLLLYPFPYPYPYPFPYPYPYPYSYPVPYPFPYPFWQKSLTIGMHCPIRRRDDHNEHLGITDAAVALEPWQVACDQGWEVVEVGHAVLSDGTPGRDIEDLVWGTMYIYSFESAVRGSQPNTTTGTRRPLRRLHVPGLVSKAPPPTPRRVSLHIPTSYLEKRKLEGGD